MREEYYYYWLGRIRGIGLRTIEEWIKEGYTPEQFYRGDSVFLEKHPGNDRKNERTDTGSGVEGTDKKRMGIMPKGRNPLLFLFF